jgi:anti-sigma B factor antagonist
VAPFEIDHRIAEGVHRLTVVGELDLATAPELGRRLAELDRGVGAVEIDLGQVSFLDACGLRCLLAAQADFDGNGGPRLALTNPSGPVRRLFGLTGLTRALQT